MKKLMILSVAAFVFASPAAFAGHHEGDHKGKMFEKADTNSDGVISKSEFVTHQQQKAEEWFGKLDTDNNGEITKQEAEAGREKMRERMKEKREMRMKMNDAPAE